MERENNKGAARALTLATIAFALTFSFWGLISALAPRFRDIYRLSAFQTSMLVAVPVLLGSLGRIPMGILADRFGGRFVFGALLLFCIVPAVGITMTLSYGSLLGWAFVLGCAGSSFSIGVAFVSKWFPPGRQGGALGIYGSGNIGQSIAVYAAPAIVAASGGEWRLPYWIFGGVTALYGVLFLLAARDSAVKAKPKTASEYIRLLRSQPLAWVLSLFYFLTFGGFVALGIYLPVLLRDIFQLSMTDAGARVAGFVLVATGMRPVGGWLADRFGGARVLVVSFTLLALAAACLTASGMVLFTIGALGSAALLGLGNGAVFKLVPQHFPAETGTVTGLVGAAGGLGGFFPPLVLGLLKAQTGSYSFGFMLLSAFALLCLAVNWRVFVRGRSHSGRRH